MRQLTFLLFFLFLSLPKIFGQGNVTMYEYDGSGNVVKRTVTVQRSQAARTQAAKDTAQFVSYTLTNPQTSQVYIGRTSGVGTPEQLVLKRYYGHLFRRSQGFRNPRVDKWSRSRDAIRGREQQLIDFYGGIGSKRVGNYIRGVSKWNIKGRRYHNASNTYFGKLAPYTGY